MLALLSRQRGSLNNSGVTGVCVCCGAGGGVDVRRSAYERGGLGDAGLCGEVAGVGRRGATIWDGIECGVISRRRTRLRYLSATDHSSMACGLASEMIVLSRRRRSDISSCWLVRWWWSWDEELLERRAWLLLEDILLGWISQA